MVQADFQVILLDLRVSEPLEQAAIQACQADQADFQAVCQGITVMEQA